MRGIKENIAVFLAERWPIVLSVLIVTASRWSTLSQPLVERHDFRQTQTAFTSLTLARGEGSLLRPQLPIFGSPWELPLEFPIFQFFSSLIYRAFKFDIDFTNRLTSLIFFILCLLPLHEVARRYQRPVGTAATVLIFSFSPLAIQWSRASTIEYCALFFGLLMILSGLKSWERPNTIRAVSFVVAGSLCGLTKSTTLVAMALALFFLLPEKSISW